MSTKHRLHTCMYTLSVTIIFVTQCALHAMHDQNLTQFDSIVSPIQPDQDCTPEFYTSVARTLQQKTLYELVMLAYTYNQQCLATPQNTNLSSVKHAIQTIIQQTIAQKPVTRNDIKCFETLTDPEYIRYTLSVLSALHKDTYSQEDAHSMLQVNRLMLMLRLKLKQNIHTPQLSAKTKKTALRSYHTQPSTGWVVIKSDTSEELYQEVAQEMVDTDVLTEDFIKKNNLQKEVTKQKRDLEHTQDALAEEYSVTRSLEHDLLKILHDYQDNSPISAQKLLTQALELLAQQRQAREEELATLIQQKKLLEHTSEQLRTEIASIAQVILDKIDSTIYQLQTVEGEKMRLHREKQDLLKEQSTLEKRLTSIDTYLNKLDATEQNLIAKQEEHQKAKKALATVHLTTAVQEGKLLPHNNFSKTS